MTVPSAVDLVGVDVEHMLGVAAGPLVKVRVTTDGPVIALGQLTPEQARQIATHLFEAAARSEYEADFVSAHARYCDAHGIGTGQRDMLDALVLGMVRNGEVTRHTGATS